jgi:hypothetical protein
VEEMFRAWKTAIEYGLVYPLFYVKQGAMINGFSTLPMMETMMPVDCVVAIQDGNLYIFSSLDFILIQRDSLKGSIAQWYERGIADP